MEFENRHPPDYEQAEKHLRVAVEHGLANAQTELGQARSLCFNVGRRLYFPTLRS